MARAHCGQGLDAANITKGHLLDSADFGVARRRRLFLVGDRKRPLRKTICTHSVPWKSAASILDPVGVWKTSPLFKAGRASATLKRAERGFRAFGEEASFLLEPSVNRLSRRRSSRQRIGVPRFGPKEGAHYFTHAGYAST